MSHVPMMMGSMGDNIVVDDDVDDDDDDVNGDDEDDHCEPRQTIVSDGTITTIATSTSLTILTAEL